MKDDRIFLLNLQKGLEVLNTLFKGILIFTYNINSHIRIFVNRFGLETKIHSHTTLAYTKNYRVLHNIYETSDHQSKVESGCPSFN